MKQMGSFLEEEVIEIMEADFLKRNLAGFIDGVIALALSFAVFLSLPEGMWAQVAEWANQVLMMLFIFAMYRLVALFVAGHTIGMWICRLRLMNAEIEPLSKLEKLCAAFFVLVDDVAYYNLKDIKRALSR